MTKLLIKLILFRRVLLLFSIIQMFIYIQSKFVSSQPDFMFS
jgi:hypothetical protein